jgi:HEAT repeat protein
LAALALLAIAGSAWSQNPSTEPVEDLRQVLKSPARDSSWREQQVKEMLGRLHDLGSLSQALLLLEWRDLDPDQSVAAVDRAQRAAAAARFEQGVRELLRDGDEVSRLAVLNLFAEMGTAARVSGSNASLTRGFTAEVVALTRQGDLATRAAAVRTLGRINPELDLARPAFAKLLTAAAVVERTAAAEGLVSLLRQTTHLALRGHQPNGVEVSRLELFQLMQIAIPLTGHGLSDAEPMVRRHSLEAIDQAAVALGQLVAGFHPPDMHDGPRDVAPPVELELAELLPSVLALRDQVPALTRALADGDAEIRRLARRTLEDAADPQLRLVERAAGARTDGMRSSSGEPPPGHLVLTAASRDTVLGGLHDTVLALAAGISAQDAQARRAAIEVLETFGPAAAPAATALVNALADTDPFVRWSAARTLGKISPVAAETAVPGLARLLADADLDLRLAAATALEHYGSMAKAAVPDLIRALSATDAPVRLAAVRTLRAIGAPDASPAVSALSTLMADPDARVRKSAAETLGKLGPAARDAVEALRQGMQDSDPAVKKASGEALLSILRPGKK